MSSSPRTAVGTGINGTDAVSKVGYLKGSGGVAPLSNMGMFLGAHSVCRLSLLNSLCARRGMLLTNWLERRGGIFFDSASTFFLGVAGPVAGNCWKITHYPLQRCCLPTGEVPCLYFS